MEIATAKIRIIATTEIIKFKAQIKKLTVAKMVKQIKFQVIRTKSIMQTI